jgi:YVTN family beta-propeller protein
MVYHDLDSLGEIRKTFVLPKGKVQGLSFTKETNPRLLVSGTGELQLLNQNLEPVQTISNIGVRQLLYSVVTSNNTIVAPAVWDNQVLLISLDTGKVLQRIVTGLNPVHIQIAPDEKTAFVTNARSGYISAIDLNTYHVSFVDTGHGSGPNGIAITENPFISTAGKLRLGAVLPLSGSLGSSGGMIMTGFEFWKESVMQAGGLLIGKNNYEVDIIYKDCQSNPDLVKTLTEELLETDKVQMLLGSYSTNYNLICAKVANEHRVPIVIPGFLLFFSNLIFFKLVLVNLFIQKTTSGLLAF